MRIGICGYGQMGKTIHRKAVAKGYEVPEVIDPQSRAPEVTAREITSIKRPVDVIIDFTHPRAVIGNIERCGELKVPVVVGTTGWYDQMNRVAAVVEEAGIGLIWSGNFSLGVNLFFRLVETAAAIMNRFPHYDAAIHEIHHRQKADSPSGTAQMIAGIMVKHLDRKSRPVSSLDNRKIDEHELHVSSTRCGSAPGTHRVIFDSDVDTITLEHSARSREGFAEGAIVAAEWIRGKKGLFTINEMMNSIIGGAGNREHI